MALSWLIYAAQLCTLIGCGLYWSTHRPDYDPQPEKDRSDWYAEQADWRR